MKHLLSVLFALLSFISCKEHKSKIITTDKSKDTFIFPGSTENLRNEYKSEFKREDALDDYLKAYAAIKEKKFEISRKNFNKALSKEPNNKYILNGLGGLLAAEGKIDSAKSLTLHAIQIDSTFDLAINAYGLYLMSQDSFQEAGKYFTKAIELAPETNAYYLNKAINFSNQHYIKDSCCKYVKLAEQYKNPLMEEHIEALKKQFNCAY